MQVVDPIAVFAEPVSRSDLIMPVAIQLGQDPIKSELIFANAGDKHSWMIAKSTVQAADAVHMQFVKHVPRIHFVTDPISIATQRNLCKDNGGFDESSICLGLADHLSLAAPRARCFRWL